MNILRTLLTGVLALTASAAFAAVTPAQIDTYLKLQKSLSEDNLDAAKTAAELLTSSEAEAVSSAAKRIAGADDLGAARSAFGDLSDTLIPLVKESKPETTLYRVHCPMARGGTGGDWLQTDKQVANPYYGSGMYRCGAVKEQISGSGSHGSHTDNGHHGHH